MVIEGHRLHDRLLQGPMRACEGLMETEAMKTGKGSSYFWLSAALAIIIVIGSGWSRNNPQATAAQAVPTQMGAGGFVAHVLESEVHPTRVVFIDGQRQVLAVYEIGSSKGEIKFLSSRNVSYDLQMMGHNTMEPLPEDIKKRLQVR